MYIYISSGGQDVAADGVPGAHADGDGVGGGLGGLAAGAGAPDHSGDGGAARHCAADPRQPAQLGKAVAVAAARVAARGSGDGPAGSSAGAAEGASTGGARGDQRQERGSAPASSRSHPKAKLPAVPKFPSLQIHTLGEASAVIEDVRPAACAQPSEPGDEAAPSEPPPAEEHAVADNAECDELIFGAASDLLAQLDADGAAHLPLFLRESREVTMESGYDPLVLTAEPSTQLRSLLRHAVGVSRQAGLAVEPKSLVLCILREGAIEVASVAKKATFQSILENAGPESFVFISVQVASEA